MATDTDTTAPKPKRKRASASRRRRPAASSRKPAATSKKPGLRDRVAAIFADPNETAKDRAVLLALVDHLDPERKSASADTAEEGDGA